MTVPDPVEAMYEEAQSALAKIVEPSLANSLQGYLSKGLLLAAASSFEFELTRHLTQSFSTRLVTAPQLASFAANTGIARRYHSWFDWESSNANKFLRLFGPDYAKSLQETVRDSNLEDAISAFMRVGELRNQLVHGNFAAFSLELTLDEIIKNYRSAQRFVQFLQNQLA